MDLKEIQSRNYQATVKRGLININTTETDFIEKIKEEIIELESEVDLPFFNDRTARDKELADVILVCLAYAKHFNIDIQTALEQKTIYNENRND